MFFLPTCPRPAVEEQQEAGEEEEGKDEGKKKKKKKSGKLAHARTYVKFFLNNCYKIS